MSTSAGTPSNKISWYKSMVAKLEHEKKLLEEAKKVAKNPNYVPRVKIGKKSKHLFENLVKENKEAKKLDKAQ